MAPDHNGLLVTSYAFVPANSLPAATHLRSTNMYGSRAFRLLPIVLDPVYHTDLLQITPSVLPLSDTFKIVTVTSRGPDYSSMHYQDHPDHTWRYSTIKRYHFLLEDNSWTARCPTSVPDSGNSTSDHEYTTLQRDGNGACSSLPHGTVADYPGRCSTAVRYV